MGDDCGRCGSVVPKALPLMFSDTGSSPVPGTGPLLAPGVGSPSRPTMGRHVAGRSTARDTPWAWKTPHAPDRAGPGRPCAVHRLTEVARIACVTAHVRRRPARFLSTAVGPGSPDRAAPAHALTVAGLTRPYRAQRIPREHRPHCRHSLSFRCDEYPGPNARDGAGPYLPCPVRVRTRQLSTISAVTPR